MLKSKSLWFVPLLVLAILVGGYLFTNRFTNSYLPKTSADVVQAPLIPPSPSKVEVDSPEVQQLNRAAYLLTGRVPDNYSLPPHLVGVSWQEFANLTQANWAKYSNAIGQPMKAWSSTEIQTDQKTVFYPFSGPDFSTLYQLFPHQDRYIMSALQPAEKLVDLSTLSPKEASQTLEVLSSAWKSFGHDGFFVTEYLYKYLTTNNVRLGATSLIATFLSLHEFSIQKIVPIDVSDQGELIELSPDVDRWNSVRFYLKKDGRPVTLDYVRMDLSDKGFSDTPKNKLFFEQASKYPVVFKAASHLPQHPLFKFVPQTVTQNSPMIVQDETGIGYGLLSQLYDTTLYGEFVKAYKVFSTYNRELSSAYKERNDEKPLPFRVGYYKDGTYAMIVAKRKKI